MQALNLDFNLSAMKQQLIVATLAFTLLSPCTYAQDSSSLDAMGCVGGAFGLVLPRDARKLPSLGKILREEVTKVERWDGYTATEKTLYFDGLRLGIVQISNDPTRVIITHAWVTKPSWNHLVPFKLGNTVKSVKGVLGAAANGDEKLKRTYRGETDEVQFETQSGVLVGVSYSCYTG